MNKISLTEKENIFLKGLFPATLLLTFSSISSKFITGYNLAIMDEQSDLMKIANNVEKIYSSDCFKVFNHPSIFVLFSLFIFLTSFALKSSTGTLYFSIISFCFLSLSVLQATCLHQWFISFANIKWNSALIQTDNLDYVLYGCFALIIFFKFKIIRRLILKKFQSKSALA